MNLLAFDPGRHLGWAYFRQGKLKKFGICNLREASIEERIEEVVCFIGALNLNVDKVVIEGVEQWGSLKSFTAAVKGDTFGLAYLVGAIAGYLSTYPHTQVSIVPAKKWKGQLPKEVIISRVNRDFNIDSRNDHICDAIGLGQWAVNNG